MGNFICEYCDRFFPVFILQLANGAIEEYDLGGTIYTEENWHEHPQVVSRRDAVFQTRKFKVGDFVKVTSEEEDHAKGWNNTWVLPMNATVGFSYKILDINNAFDKGIYLETQNNPHLCFEYPWWVLKKVDGVQAVSTVANNNCPRCQSSMNKQTSSDWSGRPFEVRKCRACGYCE
jgi:Zn ribbon nucleic-acid-binding protein